MQMNRCINIITAQALSNPVNPMTADDEAIEGHLAFLFWYLDQELEVLSNNLYEHVFLRVLRQIYVMLLKVGHFTLLLFCLVVVVDYWV